MLRVVGLDTKNTGWFCGSDVKTDSLYGNSMEIVLLLDSSFSYYGYINSCKFYILILKF
jgi:hypothetical protein